MESSVLMSVSEYLNTTFQPDCDFIDGELRERHVGEEAHAEIQAILARILGNHRVEWGIRVLTEVRVQTSEEHFRVPDVCVVAASEPRGRIIRYAPLLCVEISSREERIGELQEKVWDFASLGVRNIWVIDPVKRLGYHASREGFVRPEDGIMRVQETAIKVSLAELFAELDDI